MMRPHTAFTALLVIAFLLVLAPVTLWLHSGNVDTKLLWTFLLIALAIIVIGGWLLSKSNVVRVVRPYRRLGAGTFLFVLGALLIFALITAMLMGFELADPLQIDLQSGPVQLPGLQKLLPVAGVLLMLIGLWINQSDKYYVRLERS